MPNTKLNFKFLKGTLSAAIFATICFASPANATVVLDQANNSNDFVNFLGASSSIGQTFTVGTTGILDHIDVHLRKPFDNGQQGPPPTYDIQLSVQALAGGLPDGTVLGSATVNATTFPEAPAGSSPYTTFDLSSFGINVASGDVLAFVLTGLGGVDPADWNVFTSSSSANPYISGSKLSYNGSSWSAIGGDLAFETFVDTASGPVEVPEPASLMLLGLGVAGFRALRRRRAII